MANKSHITLDHTVQHSTNLAYEPYGSNKDNNYTFKLKNSNRVKFTLKTPSTIGKKKPYSIEYDNKFPDKKKMFENINKEIRDSSGFNSVTDAIKFIDSRISYYDEVSKSKTPSKVSTPGRADCITAKPARTDFDVDIVEDYIQHTVPTLTSYKKSERTIEDVTNEPDVDINESTTSYFSPKKSDVTSRTVYNSSKIESNTTIHSKTNETKSPGSIGTKSFQPKNNSYLLTELASKKNSPIKEVNVINQSPNKIQSELKKSHDKELGKSSDRDRINSTMSNSDNDLPKKLSFPEDLSIPSNDLIVSPKPSYSDNQEIQLRDSSDDFTQYTQDFMDKDFIAYYTPTFLVKYHNFNFDREYLETIRDYRNLKNQDIYFIIRKLYDKNLLEQLLDDKEPNSYQQQNVISEQVLEHQINIQYVYDEEYKYCNDNDLVINKNQFEIYEKYISSLKKESDTNGFIFDYLEKLTWRITNKGKYTVNLFFPALYERPIFYLCHPAPTGTPCIIEDHYSLQELDKMLNNLTNLDKTSKVDDNKMYTDLINHINSKQGIKSVGYKHFINLLKSKLNE